MPESKIKWNILVVDDEADVHDITNLALKNKQWKSKKFQLKSAFSGKEAMEILRDLDPNVNAIVSSGYSNDPVMAEYQKYGFHDFLSKPYTLKQVKNVIKENL